MDNVKIIVICHHNLFSVEPHNQCSSLMSTCHPRSIQADSDVDWAILIDGRVELLVHSSYNLRSVTCHLSHNHHVRMRDGLHVHAVGAVVHWSHVQVPTQVQRPYPWLQPLPTVSLQMSHWTPSPCQVDRRLTLCSRRHHTSNRTSRVDRRVAVCD